MLPDPSLRFVTLCYALLPFATLWYASLRFVTLLYVLVLSDPSFRFVTLRYSSLRFVTLRYALLRFFTFLCFLTLRYALLRFVTLFYVFVLSDPSLRFVTLCYASLRLLTCLRFVTVPMFALSAVAMLHKCLRKRTIQVSQWYCNRWWGQCCCFDDGNGLVQVHRVCDGTYIRTIGSRGCGDFQFGGGRCVAFDYENNIFVADRANHRVQVLRYSDGVHLRNIGGQGTDTTFKSPSGVAFDDAGHIVIAERENHCVQVLRYSDGTHVRTIGGKGSGKEQINDPSCIAIDRCGCIAVADTQNNRVLVFKWEEPTMDQWTFAQRGTNSVNFCMKSTPKFSSQFSQIYWNAVHKSQITVQSRASCFPRWHALYLWIGCGSLRACDAELFQHYFLLIWQDNLSSFLISEI